MRRCSACSAVTTEGGRFCPTCGAPFGSAAVTAVHSGVAGSVAVAATAHLQQNSATTNLVGSTIDGYAIDEILGGGAFGTVYRGRQLALERPVAFKVPTIEMAGDPITARRFAREARSAAKVDHPGVVTIYAVGELPDGRPYLAMQLVDGKPLDAILEDGPLDPPRALGIARLVASALSETHAMDVVHRDLKPSNIMWRRDRNGDDRITLVDFGIAVCKPGGADATRLTGGNLIGTPHYMSPEQAHGDEVDGRADLYALGCIVFELLTGRTPFEGSGFEVLLAHMSRPVPAPSSIVATIPPAIDALVAKLLAKKIADRAQTADEVVALIDDALGPPAAHSRRGSDEPAPKRSRARFAIVAALSVIAFGAAGFATIKLAGPAPAPTPIEDDGSDAAKRREIVSDDGSFIAKISVPETIRAKAVTRVRISLFTKFGRALDAQELVVTIEDAKGAASGFPARRRERDSGEKYFGFRHTFAEPGHYILRIFPPESDSVFRVDLDVE